MAATGAAGAAAGGADHPRMTIGQVLGLLRPEFPGVTIPKIRFWEAEGLVKPERTPAGYRKFSTGDVERLRYILTMQRDHYRPLKVIAEHLEALDSGLTPPGVEDVVPSVPRVLVTRDGFPSPESFRRRDEVRLSRRELVKLAEVPDTLLSQLEQFGLVAGRPGNRGYDRDDLLILTTAAELAHYGLEPRHLRAFKAAADREIGLVEQVVAPQRRAADPAAQARAEDTAAQLASLAVRLHATLVKAGLTGR